MKKILNAAVAVTMALSSVPAFADKSETDKNAPFSSSTFKAMEMRSIGPAYMSGRIADIAIDQNDPSTWYTCLLYTSPSPRDS